MMFLEPTNWAEEVEAAEAEEKSKFPYFIRQAEEILGELYPKSKLQELGPRPQPVRVEFDSRFPCIRRCTSKTGATTRC